MLYYYVNTGHKIGLEKLRRAVSILKKINAKEAGKTQFLVNDFRAGLVARELGLRDYVTIETVQDIDAIAQGGDSIIIDSIEDDHGRLVKYCTDFKRVWRFSHSTGDKPIHTEKVIPLDSISIDETYQETLPKEERVLFFLGDSDYDKTILKNDNFFKNFKMELLLGTYFFVKYEDDLAKLFTTLHEPEEYETLIKETKTIVTTSSHTALEAIATGARVIFLDISLITNYSNEILEKYGVEIVKGFDVEKVQQLLADNRPHKNIKIEQINEMEFMIE